MSFLERASRIRSWAFGLHALHGRRHEGTLGCAEGGLERARVEAEHRLRQGRDESRIGRKLVLGPRPSSPLSSRLRTTSRKAAWAWAISSPESLDRRCAASSSRASGPDPGVKRLREIDAFLGASGQGRGSDIASRCAHGALEIPLAHGENADHVGQLAGYDEALGAASAALGPFREPRLGLVVVVEAEEGGHPSHDHAVVLIGGEAE